MTLRQADFIAAGAETLIGLTSVSLNGKRGEFACEPGQHLTDPEIGQVRGALGIALDDATGYVVVEASPVGRWPVSLSIRIDFVADVPAHGIVTVASELISCTDTVGTTRGVATGPGGEVLALMTQRSHLLASNGPDRDVPSVALPPVPTGPLRELLGFAGQSGELTMAPTPWSGNAMGNVHGGVLITGVELAAHSAAGRGFTTTSIDIAYVRPCDASAPVTFRASTIHCGRSAAVLSTEAVRADGRPAAHATVVLQR